MKAQFCSYSLPATLIGMAALALAQPQLLAVMDVADVNQIAKETTVLVNGQSPGSGILINNQGDTYYVLTAKHVVETEDEYSVVTPDNSVHPLDFNQIQMLPEMDLAVAQFNSPQLYPTAALGNSNTLTEGDTVFIAGWPIEGQAIPQIYQFTLGQISGLPNRPLPGGYGLIYTNTTRAGMSGGPVFNEDGKVVGIHGQAEGREVYLPNYEYDPTEILAGFNLGIPVNLFLNEARKLPLTLEDLPAPPVAQNPSRSVYFAQPLGLIDVSAPNRTEHRESSYYFTINLPADAAQSLEQVTFKQIEGHDYPRFSVRETHAFEGRRNNRSAPLPLSLVANDTSAKTLTVTFDPPVRPGREFTIALRANRNPDEGTYIYRLTAFPPNKSSQGQRIGTGRLQFYEPVRR